jgi:hypothetical protein
VYKLWSSSSCNFLLVSPTSTFFGRTILLSMPTSPSACASIHPWYERLCFTHKTKAQKYSSLLNF